MYCGGKGGNATDIFELEKQSGVRESGSTTTKAKPTLHSLHGRLAKIRKGLKRLA
jgi:hypothetical protein